MSLTHSVIHCKTHWTACSDPVQKYSYISCLQWMLCLIIKLTWSFNVDWTWPLNITVTHFMTDQHTNFKGIASRFGFIPCRLPHSTHKIFWRIKIDQWLLKISDSMISNCFNLDLVNLSDYLSLVSFEENNHFEFQVWKISKSHFFITI